MATTLVNAYSIHVEESTKAELRNIHAGIMENTLFCSPQVRWV